VLLTGSWLAAAAGAGFALATLGGYLLSVWVGLFGFKEVRTTAGPCRDEMPGRAYAMRADGLTPPDGPARLVCVPAAPEMKTGWVS
jgi:hypothetical protein